ncbi:MAG TPA: prepilin-type N-terminal cleavage/methylation domain-containing protein [Vicinamibacterales bacterium]|jgi:prepilin-type N-terminal cleavage/methylation domain-containing protein|nr:prepilin-type N-terminal cleavage/methylation domain-containing protein [Vicinamibacterales bacterium]
MVRDERGFSLIELLVAMLIMLIISGAATSALLKMTSTQATIWNRTQMHSGIRGATEVLQQEVGQAGRIALPAAVALTSAVTLPGTATVGVTSTTGMFPNEYLAIDAGSNQETVQITAVSTSPAQITATFGNVHLLGATVAVYGAFQAGVVPPSATNGSTATVLKLFGDVNGDGNMVYVEYTCDITAGNLYRNSMAWNTATKAAATASQILLSNIIANPGGTACFTYQTSTMSGYGDFVTNVAVTLTVQTQQLDPVTKSYQTETKALLNVAPRNIVNAAALAFMQQLPSRVQPTPAAITNLLP